MKITRSHLRGLIREQMHSIIAETGDDPFTFRIDKYPADIENLSVTPPWLGERGFTELQTDLNRYLSGIEQDTGRYTHGTDFYWDDDETMVVIGNGDAETDARELWRVLDRAATYWRETPDPRGQTGPYMQPRVYLRQDGNWVISLGTYWDRSRRDNP